MMHLFINALGASAGSGLTYLYNVVPLLRGRGDVRVTLAIQSNLRRQFERSPEMDVLHLDVPTSSAIRFLREQRTLPRFIRESGAEVLISAGNFALRKPPIPQILLSGNSLYISDDFNSDLRHRFEYRMLLDNRIKGFFAKKSVGWADCTVAPTRAFADQLRRWGGKETFAIHHGFDEGIFFREKRPLPDDIQRALCAEPDCLKLLFVSHYNYYRNFETLFRAVPIIRDQLRSHKLRLYLTCKLKDKANPGAYKPQKAAQLVRQLGIGDEVVELGAVPYNLLHHIYRACDIYVTPAYTETFAHPLVEAMASGMPIVASDLAVHREVAGPAAHYFDRFSHEDLAAKVLKLSDVPQGKAELGGAGRRRVAEFSWKKHIEELLTLATSICEGQQRALAAA